MKQMHVVGVTSNIYQQIENQSTIQKTNYPEINETKVELPQCINQISQILKHKETEEKGYIKSLIAVVSKAEAIKNMAIMVVRKSATNDIFEPILFFLLDDVNQNEFQINLEITSKDGRNPLQIAKDFKTNKVMHLLETRCNQLPNQLQHE